MSATAARLEPTLIFDLRIRSGLGVGISARGFHNHGLNTTIVEIDPAVYHAARTYFGLASPRGGVILEDAREFMAREEGDYDYIIHDVVRLPSVLLTLR